MKESTVAGRVGVHSPGHRGANGSGYVLRSRLVMEGIIGQPLGFNEHVHHRDEDEENDAPDNLEILTRAEHTRRHWELGTFSGVRRLDYALIESMARGGLGYKRIAREIGENVNTVHSACRRIRLGHK